MSTNSSYKADEASAPARQQHPCPQQPHASQGASVPLAKRTPILLFTRIPNSFLSPDLAVYLSVQPYPSLTFRVLGTQRRGAETSFSIASSPLGNHSRLL